MKVTLHCIAKELDVSSATVSRSLRDDPAIHPATRARVTETALRLGYQGASGRLQRTDKRSENDALGLLMHVGVLARARHDPNAAQIVEGVMEGARKQGFLLNVHAISDDEQRLMEEDAAAVPTLVRDRICRGIILRGAIQERDAAYIAEQVPVVSVGRIYRGLNIDTVLSDDVEGVRALVVHLSALGHRRLAWLGGHSPTTFFEARQAGFVQGCLGEGLPLVEQRFFGREIYRDYTLRHVGEILGAVRGGTTALLCANDLLARQVMEVLENEGLRVPEDVSVTGFDAWPVELVGRRQLTSVDPNFREMGRAAVRLAVLALEHRAATPLNLLVRSEIVVGETTAAVKSG